MADTEITPGAKIGKALAARWVKPKENLGLEVAFEFEETSVKKVKKLFWTAWMSEKAMEESLKRLTSILGYNGSEACDENGFLTDPKALEYGKEVQLVVELEPYDYTNDEGVKFSGQAPKIKWVNKLGGSGYEGCAPEVVKNALGALGFKAAFLAAKAKVPETKGKKLPF